MTRNECSTFPAGREAVLRRLLAELSPRSIAVLVPKRWRKGLGRSVDWSWGMVFWRCFKGDYMSYMLFSLFLKGRFLVFPFSQFIATGGAFSQAAWLQMKALCKSIAWRKNVINPKIDHRKSHKTQGKIQKVKELQAFLFFSWLFIACFVSWFPQHQKHSASSRMGGFWVLRLGPNLWSRHGLSVKVRELLWVVG